MYDKGIFVFGSKIFPEKKQDVISTLPLELSWKIFSFLDDMSLRVATRAHKIWHRIILSNRHLRNRLNKFELAITLGSESLAKFYRKNKKRLKRKEDKNFLPLEQCMVKVSKATVFNKRGGDDLVIYTKRFRLF